MYKEKIHIHLQYIKSTHRNKYIYSFLCITKNFIKKKKL